MKHIFKKNIVIIYRITSFIQRTSSSLKTACSACCKQMICFLHGPVYLLLLAFAFLSAWILPEIQIRRFDLNLFPEWLFSENSILNLILILAFSILLFTITRKPLFSNLLLLFASGGLSIADSMKSRFLGTPLLVTDIYFLKKETFMDLVKIISGYSVHYHIFVALSLSFSFLLLFIVFWNEAKIKISPLKRIILFLFSVLLISIPLWTTIYEYHHQQYSTAQSATQETFRKGVLYSFFSIGFRDVFLESDDSVISINNLRSNNKFPIKKIQIPQQKNSPNIILIIWESFFNLEHIPNLKVVSGELLSNYNSYFAKKFRRQWFSPVFGGLSCNADMETMTGIPMYFFQKNTIPAIDIIAHKKTISSAFLLQHQNYQTSIYSAEQKKFFAMERFYKNIGYQSIYSAEDYPNASLIEKWEWASDETLLTFFLSQKLDQSEKPFFPTIRLNECHGPYEDVTTPKIHLSHPSLNESEIQEIQNYAEKLNHTDELLKNLILYFQKSSRKTIIFIISDHLPGFLNTFHKTGYTRQDPNKIYHIESAVWANFKLPEKYSDHTLFSLNYFPLYLFQTASLPITPYLHTLENASKEYPILSYEYLQDKSSRKKVMSNPALSLLFKTIISAFSEP